MNAPRVAYEGQLFRITERDVPWRSHPFEFAQRVGAVAVLPVFYQDAAPWVLTVMNNRYLYGASFGLPAGNIGGGFDSQELPKAAALRELQEETGYGYTNEAPGQVSVLELDNPSRTYAGPRFLVVARNIHPVANPRQSNYETVTNRPMTLEAFLEPILDEHYSCLPAEVTLAFSRAARKLGKDVLIHWLSQPHSPHEKALAVCFDRWLRLQ